MDQADVVASGRITVKGDGSVSEDKFAIKASAGFAKGGTVSLTVRPGWKPNASAGKDGVSTNLTSPVDMVGLGNIDDFDVNISKSGVDIQGQSCDITLDSQRLGQESQANRLTIKTNVEAVGAVGLTLTQAGYVDHAKRDKVEGQGAKLSVDLNKFVQEISKDVTASVDYNLSNDGVGGADVNLGIKAGDLSVKLKTSAGSLTNLGSLKHKINANYVVEGINAGVEVESNGTGRVEVSKSGYQIAVPISKDNGIDTDGATLKKTWSVSLA